MIVGKRFIQSIRLDNLLSYGPDKVEFALEPLNVLVGPNASGKSNLIEALSLLAGAPGDLQDPIRRGGAVRDWLWKGADQTPTATIEVTLKYPILLKAEAMAMRYRLSFTDDWGRFRLVDEVLQSEKPMSSDTTEPYYYYRYQGGEPVINVANEAQTDRLEQRLTPEHLRADQSILSQMKDPLSYPELTNVSWLFQSIGFFGDWYLGRNAPPRLAQNTDAYQSVLLRDASNLPLVLSDLLNNPTVRDRILEYMRDFCPSFKNITTAVGGGTVQTFFHEDDLHHPVPATRLSYGSLNYLCLLAILCHPNPPGIVCIEEPEVGLHPDVLPDLAKLLVEASSRSQLFVTTHSDILVDALTDEPEAVIVCEKVDGSTQLRRLDADQLKPWLEDYRLGELWTGGHIGGNRW